MAPRFSHGAVAAGLSSLDSVAGGGGADPTLTSTLGDIVDTTSPYSFSPTLTHTGTVVTTITRASDASSVSVTGDTTTTPTATCTAADAALGDSFHCESVATLDGITKTLVSTVFMEGAGGGVTAIDPDADTPTLPDVAEASATSGSVLGTIAFRGPSQVDPAEVTVSVTGTDAALITLADSGTPGTLNVVAASNLTPTSGDAGTGVLVWNAVVEGYVAAQTNTIIPDSVPFVMAVTNDGYLLYSENGGAWTAVLFASGVSFYSFDVDPSTGNLWVVANVAGATADMLTAGDITTTTSSGMVNVVGSNVPQACVYVPSIDYFITGDNARTMRSKTGAALVTSDPDTSSGPTGTSTLNLSSWGSGDYTQALWYSVLSDRTYVAGENARMSYCTTDPTAAWTYLGPPDSWSGTIWGGAGDATYDIVCGASGQVAYTSDGTTWARSTAGAGIHYKIEVNPAGQWCMVGAGGTIYTTSDPTSGWTSRTSGSAADLRSVDWDAGGGQWVVGGTSKTLLTSSDGITWASETVPAGPGAGSIIYAVRGRTIDT